MIWQVNGEVTYNGHKMNEFVPQKTAAYVNQNDLHVAQMTVRETLEYSAKSQDVGPNRYGKRFHASDLVFVCNFGASLKVGRWE